MSRDPEVRCGWAYAAGAIPVGAFAILAGAAFLEPASRPAQVLFTVGVLLVTSGAALAYHALCVLIYRALKRGDLESERGSWRAPKHTPERPIYQPQAGFWIDD